MAGYLNRENRVPYYQRLFQEGHKQHIRQWNQTRMGRNMLRVYYTTFIITGAGSMWMMGRMVLGKKTWWG
ncbi:hypothetical protein HYALB_00011849 [Hymenoscyphus albidus]|uniref:Uncharacterized protein n=1 Tax=Hymenoscyphus albidus TaxID=595503 RepID=A0A9N9QAF4_9HELO|nr:hypothetical protein HYALB_00011849 [Hymenoscyphus albidus]